MEMDIVQFRDHPIAPGNGLNTLLGKLYGAIGGGVFVDALTKLLKAAHSSPFFVSLRAYEYSKIADHLPNRDLPVMNAKW